jgi:hypothetical protein
MKTFAQKFSTGILKVLFVIVCYIITVCFAVFSGYFTVIFYNTGYIESNITTYYMITGLAGLFEFTKTLMSITHPFMANRNKRIETITKIYLRVALIMSILASLSFFLSSDISKTSPPNQIVSIIYSYLPILDIIPIKLVQFCVTISLSIFIEVLIIIIPSIAVVFMHKKKEQIEEEEKKTYAEKLKQFQDFVLTMDKDKLKKKVPAMFKKKKKVSAPKTNNDYVDLVEKLKELQKEQSKLKAEYDPVDGEEQENIINDYVEGINGNDYEEEIINDHEIEEDDPTPGHKIGYETTALKKDEKTRMTQVNSTDAEIENYNIEDVKRYLEAMYFLSKDKNNNVSVGQLHIEKEAKLTNKQMRFIRGYLEKLGIIEIKGKFTYIKLSYDEALKRVNYYNMQYKK